MTWRERIAAAEERERAWKQQLKREAGGSDNAGRGELARISTISLTEAVTDFEAHSRLEICPLCWEARRRPIPDTVPREQAYCPTGLQLANRAIASLYVKRDRVSP